MWLNLLEPISYIVESQLLCAVEDQKDAHGAFVVSLCDSSKSFLSSSIPHLQLYSLVVDWNRLNLEIDTYTIIAYSFQWGEDELTYRGHVTSGELVLWEAKKDTGFSNGGVPNDDEFDQVVVILFTGLHFNLIIIINHLSVLAT